MRYREIRRSTAQRQAPLEPDETEVRIIERLDEAGYRATAALLAPHPNVLLWLDDRGEDLEPLRWFEGVRRVRATSLH